MANLWYLGMCSLFTLFLTFTCRPCELRQLTHSRLTAWNLGCGFAQNTAELIAFRFLSGLGGSATLSVRITSHLWSVQLQFIYLNPRFVVP